MKTKTNMLTIVFFAALLPSCAIIKDYIDLVKKDPSLLIIEDPSDEDAKRQFIETCMGNRDELQNNARIDFAVTNRVEKDRIYDVYCWAEIEYLKDGHSHRKGEKRCHEGFIRFHKEEKGWSLPENSVYCHRCRM